ncbi:hypothetical protein D5F01_LYC24359 [Larimichthys crocea]|uniref:Major capsid protein n=1 Tax=Larimichthys crocea TaxID=215358 RepID=A0A6G0HF36_LARCR|nr:hypothetical protein D5F01_LYC24359 [Larimichthys crocea]
MSVVTMDPSSCMLRPLETVRRLVKAPKFLADASGAFAEFIVDNMIRPSAANSSISADATVVVSQAHMGVTLFRQQRDTSRLLAGFVYKMLVPDEAVPTGTRFRKCYRITDQREAQQGTYDTVTNGVQTREYSQVFQHTSKVVTMQFGSLLNVTVPSVAMDLIRRELDRVSTSWELTRTIEVLKYCAAQPTLTDMVAQRTKTYSPAEKLDAILVMAELLCGVINLQPDSFLCVLENARRMLGSDKPEVIVVGDTLFRIISQRSSNSTLCTQIVTEDTKITPEFSVYTMANENTRVGGGYEFTMQQHTHTLGDKDLPFTNESCFQDSSIDMKVSYIRLGGGSSDKIPIVHVDGVQMEHGNDRDTSTEHKAFCNTEGHKWEFATVGCTAPALSQINPSHVLSTKDSEDINYKQLAQRSPSTSYIHQYDGAVACVSLRDLHPVGNPKELFTHDRRTILQNHVNALMRGNPDAVPVEKLACLALTRDWYGKIKNPASVLEFDARNMVVPRPPQGSFDRDVVPERWVVRPRVALFNSSSMNSIDNEIAQIGSELLTHFGDTEHAKQVSDNLAFLEQALHYEQGVQSMLRMRAAILTGERFQDIENSDDWTQGRTFWSWLADPICAVHARRVLAEKETASHITAGERTVLLQLEGLVNSLLELFKSIVGSRNNSVIASMPACFHVAADPANNNLTEHGYPVNFTLDDVDYCNLMYWIILPALGARVYRTCTESGRGAPTVPVPIQYREHERNLTNELNLNNQNALTVPRLNSRCAFSKVVPRDCEDVSEQFEPTALVHKRCTDRGFSDTSVVTYMWAIRLQKLAGISNSLAKVLLGIHYSTLLTHNVIQEHYDTKYYSGMSYLLFRGVRFTGCGVSLMQQKSALYTLGTEIICKPTAHNTHQVHTVNQYCESVVIPETLESPGVYMPNLYMKDVRGGDVHINTGGPFDMVVADAFNGFCPESDSASGYRRPFIFTTGRSERLNGSITRDPMMRAEAYTCMPTLLHPFSSALRAKNRHGSRNRDNEESNHKLFCNTLHMVEFEKGVLDPIGNPFRDTVERVNGDKRTTDIMQPLLGVAFCATYGIGLTSDKKLMCVKDETRETLVDRLAPRISGVGIFACNPIQTTSRLINPIFSRIFESNRYSRFFQW